MKTFASALLFVCSASALALEQQEEYENSLTYPGDKCCRLYTHWYYHELQEEEFCIQDSSEETSQRFDISLAHHVQSYICGKNVAVDACVNGFCAIKSAGFVMNPDTYVWWREEEDRYIDMKLYDPAIIGAVTFFRKDGCKGQTDRYSWKADTPFEGAYNYRSIEWEFDPMSVHVPSGYSLRCYKDDLWTDFSEDIVGEYEDDSTQKPKCQDLVEPGQCNSWKVVKNRYGQENPDPALGFWKGITSTESQEFEYRVGISNTESAGSSSENAASIEHALTIGISKTAEVSGSYGFVSGGVSTTYSAEYGMTSESSSIAMQDAQTAMQEDYGIVHKTTCKTEGKNGAGLYQYVYSTSDGRANLFTSHTVCRVGEDWNTPPACHWHACKNPDCTCCEGDLDCQ